MKQFGSYVLLRVIDVVPALGEVRLKVPLSVAKSEIVTSPAGYFGGYCLSVILIPHPFDIYTHS